MRGRMLMFAAGRRMGEQQAEAQIQAQAQQQAAIEQARQEGAAQVAVAQAPAPAAGGLDDASIAKLKQLADLHTSGVLSDEEFTAAKKKILG